MLIIICLFYFLYVCVNTLIILMRALKKKKAQNHNQKFMAKYTTDDMH